MPSRESSPEPPSDRDAAARPVATVERPFDVEVRPPGSKSITNRAYVLAALGQGTTVLQRPLRADDTDRLLAALRILGASIELVGDDVRIEGARGRFPRGGHVDLGDGGTPARFLIAAACLASAPVIVDGSLRMRERPVAEGIEQLRHLGAVIEYLNVEGRLPVRVTPARLTGGRIAVGPTRSSQFISALMLIAPFLPRGLMIETTAPLTSASYVKLTAHELRAWGVPVEMNDSTIHVPADPVHGVTRAIEPDASSALYWLGAVALVPGARVRVRGFDRHSPQPDAMLVDVLAGAGLSVSTEAGDLVATGGPVIDGFDVDAGGAPDGAMLLAALAAVARGPSRLRGLHTLRYKESDRIDALATELRRLGCTVLATDETLAIEPAPAREDPVLIETYDDHRIAMAFAVLGLVRPGISIADPACVGKSYPGFWDDLARVYGDRANDDT